MSVLVDIILQLPEVAFVLPRPQDAELTKCAGQYRNLPHGNTRWSTGLIILACPPELSRVISKKETGLPFSVWKQKMRILESVLMLKKNKSVTAVALDVGYSSTAAFSYAFRQHLAFRRQIINQPLSADASRLPHAPAAGQTPRFQSGRSNFLPLSLRRLPR